jgi:cyanophycinase
MTRRRLLAPSVLLISAIAFAPRAATLTAAQWPSAAKAAAPEYGPPNGTLVIAGGSTMGLPAAIIEKFIELGGGVDGKFVIVPTAGGNFDGTGDDKKVHVYVESQVISPWLNRGLKNVKMLHTHDPKIADTVEFAKVLSDATAVWFTGGRHWNIVDSYAGTLTYREFHKVLERGGVIGGSSAGATIQGDYLVRGDTSGPNIVMTEEPNHQKGFEFLRRSAIDQHIDARNRWDDLIPVIKKYPNLLGIGLSEDTAIVVKGDQFEVMGKSKVAIHDNTRKYVPWEKPYYLLGAGDTYNMRTRKVVNVRHRPPTSEPTGTARPRSSAASAPPADSSRLAAPSGTTVGPGNGSGAVPAPIPIRLPRLLERLLMIAGDDESWWQIEVIDVDSDGEIDLLRIHLINGDTMVWEIGR